MKSKTLGYVFVLLAITIFAAQDGFTKLLSDRYPPLMVTMVRFWAFAFFVIALAAASPAGLRGAMITKRPLLQIARGLLLVGEIVLVVFAYMTAGLAMSQAILQAAPLLVTILSVPFLGEKVGWRRGIAISVGLFGVLVILNPVNVHFDVSLLLPLTAALIYAIYSVATRAVSRYDSSVTSVFYAGLAGAIAISLIGPFYWQPIVISDWLPMGALCVCGAISHYFLIKAYSYLEAVEVQPLTYIQLVLSVGVAVVFFGEVVTWNMAIGATIVVGAGLFTVRREHQLERRKGMIKR
ncbi:DMT family transporter [Phyllobacterium sp. YR531]|uniref:DMT family transporter n=1 Tax=Phyllobacterium sp. YR531 TaxID=1144343 RepID=UPI00026F52B4|nr:DMT family transporter [Phyllobacterium sp. YR531]EJN02489.1 DMT(drug/metabolite transporter) superfamily permease [Phyllobacterium sp. YR531]